MLACRACRVPMSASTGCAVCNVARANLVVVGESEDERPSLAGTGNEALSALRVQILHHAGILKTNPGNGKSESGLIACTNALAKLTGEVRKLQDDGKKAVDAMAFTERCELFITWVTELPPAYRQNLKERLEQWERSISEPVSPAALLLDVSGTSAATRASEPAGSTTQTRLPVADTSDMPKPAGSKPGGSTN